MNIYDFEANDYLGNLVSLKQYEGKVILVVNTATRCGFTPLYDGLEALYEKYEKDGFVILDFPCNQFLAQAPGSSEDIHSACVLRFGTKFPQFEKIKVNLMKDLIKKKPRFLPKNNNKKSSNSEQKKLTGLQNYLKSSDSIINFGASKIRLNSFRAPISFSLYPEKKIWKIQKRN